MKNTKSNKLNLNRETLVPLTGDDLEAVNGGITPTFIYSAFAISGAVSSFNGSNALVKNLRSK